MALPTAAEITFKRGDTWKRSFPARQKDVEGTPVDLTGTSIRMDFRNKKTKVKAFRASSESGEFVLSEVEGVPSQWDMTILPAVTRGVQPGDYLLDLELTFADGTVASTRTVWALVEEDQTYD